jgi:hypothetical protein
MNTVGVIFLVTIGLIALIGLLGVYLVYKKWQELKEYPISWLEDFPISWVVPLASLVLSAIHELNILPNIPLPYTALPPFPTGLHISGGLHNSGPNPMPANLRDALLELEKWAQANKRDASRDIWAFWGLKIPAILASASAGVWAHFDLKTVSVIFGAVASACVIVDGIHPRGMLRNTHLRAYHDLRILATKMVGEWRTRTLNANDDNTARRIIRNAEEERQRIALYIRDAETALNPSSTARP